MTKILLAALVAAMLALTGLVAYNSFNAVDTVTPTQVTATDDDACPACCEKESAGDACPGCPLAEKGGCCKEQQLKSPCCGGDAAVKPGAAAPKAEAKKE
jgi:hypothetical protein